MSRFYRQRRPPVVPADRLRPPTLDWSRELDRQRDRHAHSQHEETAPPADAGPTPRPEPPEEAPQAAPQEAPDAEAPQAAVAPAGESIEGEQPFPPEAESAPAAEPESELGQETEVASTPEPDAPAPSPAPAETEVEAEAEADQAPLEEIAPAVEPPPAEPDPPAETEPSRGAAAAGTPESPPEPDGGSAASGAPGFDELLRPAAPGATPQPVEPFPARPAVPSLAAPPLRPPRSRRWRASPGSPPARRRPRGGRPGAPMGRGASIAVIAVLAVTCAALVALNVLRIQQSGAEAARQAAAYSPPALAATGTPAAAAPPVVVLGGTGATDPEAVPPAALLERGLDGAAVRVDAVAGARYVAGPGGTAATFEALAGSVPADARVVALVGGGGDRSASVLTLATAVDRAIRAVRKQAPDAQIVLVGPLAPASVSPPQGVLQVRAILRAAAGGASAHFVDPIAGHWLAGPSAVTATGRLSAAGRQELARRLVAALAPYTS